MAPEAERPRVLTGAGADDRFGSDGTRPRGGGQGAAPNHLRAAEAATRGAVSRWFLDDDPAWILEIHGMRGLLPGGIGRLHSVLGPILTGDSVPTAAEALERLRIEGYEDEVRLLERMIEASVEPSPVTYSEALDALQLWRGAGIVGQIAADLEAGQYRTTADLIEALERVTGEMTRGRRAGSRFRTIRRLADLPLVTRPTYHVDGLIYDQAFTICGGDPKAGKSTLALALAVGTLTGTPVLGRAVLRTGPVAIVEADMNEGHLSWVLRQVGLGMGVDLEQEMEFPISYHCATDIDLLNAGTRAELTNDIAALKPGLVVLDPLADLQSGNENDRHELKPALDFCLALRDGVGTSVLLVDHLSKPVPGGRSKGPAGYALRGSGAKYGRADSVLIVRDLEGTSEVSGRHRYGPATASFCYRVVVDEAGHRLEECEQPEGGVGGRRGGAGGGDCESAEQRILNYLRRVKTPQSVNKIAMGAGVQKAKVSDALLNLYGREEITKDEEESYVRWFAARSGSRSGGNRESSDSGSGNAFGNQFSDSRSGSRSGGNQSGTGLGGEVVPVVPAPVRGGTSSGTTSPTANSDGLPPWGLGGSTDGSYTEEAEEASR